MQNPSTILGQRQSLPVGVGLGVALLAVSSAALFIKFAQGAGIPSLAIAAYRLSIAVIVISPWVLWRHRAELRALTRRQLGLALISGFFLGLHFATWISSLDYTSVASSTVLVTTSPLIVGLLSPIFLREPLTRKLLVGILIATTGALIIGLWDSCQWQNGLVCQSLGDLFQGRTFVGNALAFAGAVAVAFYLMIGRSLRASLTLNVYIWLVYGAAAGSLLVGALLLRTPLTGFSPIGLLWLLLLALVPQLVGHSLFNWALRYVPASVVSVVTLGEPIFATVLVFLLLGEQPNAGTLVGGMLILSGIFIATYQPAPRMKSA